MPRYEVEFPNVKDAFDVANTLKTQRTAALMCQIKEHAGTEIVIDMSVSGLAFSVSLLFRIIQSGPQQTIIEWWPRRQTDPALLDLWLDALKTQQTTQLGTGEDEESAETDKPQHTTESVRVLFDLCRRSLSKNPFTALDVHWSSDLEEIKVAYSDLLKALEPFRKSKGLSPKAYQLIGLAKQQAKRSFQEISTPAGRIAARKRFVPSNQLSHARELLSSKIQVAQLRGDTETYHNLRRKLEELGA